MNNFFKVFVGFIFFFLNFGYSFAQDDGKIWVFKIGSTQDEVSIAIKQLKNNGICNDPSSGFDFFTKKPSIGCRHESYKLEFLSLPIKKSSFNFNSKSERLSDIEFWFGFPKEGETRARFQSLVRDMERISGQQAIVSVDEDKVGNQVKYARVRTPSFNITLREEATFGPFMVFWKTID